MRPKPHPAIPANYFTCTLGEATALSPDLSGIDTISAFIDHRAASSGADIAVGFPIPSNDIGDWSYELFSKFLTAWRSHLLRYVLNSPSVRRPAKWVGGGCLRAQCYSFTRYERGEDRVCGAAVPQLAGLSIRVAGVDAGWVCGAVDCVSLYTPASFMNLHVDAGREQPALSVGLIVM